MKTSRKYWVLAVGVTVLLVLLLCWFLRLLELKGGQRSHSAGPPPKTSKGLLGVFKTLNHNSIEFYGRAVDQYGEPVASAEVVASVLVNTGMSGGVRKARTRTDGQGYFSFTGLAGQDLTMVISKQGYEFSTRTKLFSYTYFEADHKRYIPDPKNPAVFVMWKKQGAEPLVHYEWRSWRLPSDGTPLGVNLEKGKIAPNDPDLVVRFRRADGPSNKPGYAWSAQIEVPKGGLILAPNLDFYNLAPTDGYVTTFEYVQPSYEQIKELPMEGRKPWNSGAELMFWVKTRDGKQFGRVRLMLNPPNEKLPDGSFKTASFDVEAWINPSGSRNLEYDYSKEICPPY